MNEEIDESELYHRDFTTASNWEIFIARLEEVINQWSTDEIQGEDKYDTYGVWNIRTERISFVEVDFNLQHYRKNTLQIDSPTEETAHVDNKPKNPIQSMHDFELFDSNNSTTHTCLSTWYGLDEYMVISPVKDAGITTESRIKILLSSIYIVASNLGFGIPIFVQIQEKWQACYLGVYEEQGVRTNFEMVHLRRGPPPCKYLTGLLELFKTKIMSPIHIETITVSVQLTYVLSYFGNHTWRHSIHQLDGNYTLLPFGVTHEPVSSIVLKTSWSHLPDHQIVDSESYSDFDPMQAPKWSLLAKFNYDEVALLGDTLRKFLHLFKNNTNVIDLISDYITLPSPESSPLDVLTEPVVPTISTLFNRAARKSLTRNQKSVAPIEDSVLVSLLYFLFPDADERCIHLYKLGKDISTDKNVNKFVKMKFK